MFDYLAVGLYQLQTRAKLYPYPPVFEYGLNLLAAKVGVGFPPTLRGILEIFQRPISEWWRDEFGPLPVEIDQRFSLLEAGSQIYLHEQLEDYLFNFQLPGSGRIRPEDILLHQHNELIAAFVHELREAYEVDSQSAQYIYRTVRSFINTHPFITPMKMRRALILPTYHDKVLEFYEPVTHVPDLAMRDNCFLNCPNCGVVVHRNGVDSSAKASLCQAQCPGDGGWIRVEDADDLHVLKRGVLLRTHIPGQPEMRLYRWLTEVVGPKNPELEVELYPGIDRYDLRLIFRLGGNQTVWAIDVKDHRTPAVLSSQLLSDPRPYYLGDWQWSQAYYVIPDYRLRVHPTFIDDVRHAAGLPRLQVDIVSESDIRRAVLDFLEEGKR
jgi:hypothetical protein